MNAVCRNCLNTGIGLFNEACSCGIPYGSVGEVPIGSVRTEEANLITVEDVKRITVNPGEVLLVRMPDKTSATLMGFAQRTLQDIFKGSKVLLYHGDIEFTVVKHECCLNGAMDTEHDCLKKPYCGAV